MKVALREQQVLNISRQVLTRKIRTLRGLYAMCSSTWNRMSGVMSTSVNLSPALEVPRHNLNPQHFHVSELESAEAQGAQWWDLNGSMRPLHTMNKLRIPLIRKGLLTSKRITKIQSTKPRFLEGLKVLDVGCGGGILSEALARAGGDVTGLDPSEELVTLARAHASKLDVRPPSYVCDTIESHSSKFPAAYDVVIASEVVEHVPNKETFLSGCVAALKPGGSLFTTTPNRTLLSWLGAIIVCENILRIVPHGFHSWKQFIHDTDLVAMLNKHGCRVKKVRGMFYDPLRNKWNWIFTSAFIYAVHSIKMV